MIFDSFDIGYLYYILFTVLCFVPAIVLHEVAHGYAAYKLGDPTAKQSGRLSLNPLKHIDLFGTVIMPGMLMFLGWPVFGYAKPVPYNPLYFKDKRKGDLLVGLAGPAANLAMALAGVLVCWLLYFFLDFSFLNEDGALSLFLIYLTVYFPMFFVYINLYLMFFNLLPIPPLDGSSIFAFLLPEKYLPTYYRIQQYALPVFMVLVLVIPYVLNFNPISLYLEITADNLASLLLPFTLY